MDVAPALRAGGQALQHDDVAVAIGNDAGQAVGFAVKDAARRVRRIEAAARAAAAARATSRREECRSSIVASSSNDQTRARICDDGE